MLKISLWRTQLCNVTIWNADEFRIYLHATYGINLDKYLLKLYTMFTVLFLGLFLIAVLRIIFDIAEPSPMTLVRALGYLIIANQNVMLYNQNQMRNEIKQK